MDQVRQSTEQTLLVELSIWFPSLVRATLALKQASKPAVLDYFAVAYRAPAELANVRGFSFGLTRLDVRDGVDGHDLYGNTSGAGRFQVSLSPSIDVAANFYGTTSNAITNNSPQPLAAAFTSTQRFPRAVEGVTFHPDFNNPDQGRRNSIWAASIRFTQRINEDCLLYRRLSKGFDAPPELQWTGFRSALS